QIATVIPYWERWIARFPTVQSLARASEEEILQYWQGLGYYRRARMLQAGAVFVVENGFPVSAEDWRKVPGVGQYTAAAIASICLSEHVAVVDGNVKRVFSRFTAANSGEREAWNWAQEILDQTRPGDWNQAMMELGATICTPKNPSCHICPLQCECRAFSQGTVLNFPAVKVPTATKRLYQQVLVQISGESVRVQKIPTGRWWEGLFEFGGVLSEMRPGPIDGYLLGSWKYAVTNHRIEVHAMVDFQANGDPSETWVRIRDLEALPMPAIQRKIARKLRAMLQVEGAVADHIGDENEREQSQKPNREDAEQPHQHSLAVAEGELVLPYE
ncbi:MAG: hypothetical protein K8R88_13495, partial [Armatimonadetes bacterium]|nr:hypothetical protein [Armatimonadota bacterium]